MGRWYLSWVFVSLTACALPGKDELLDPDGDGSRYGDDCDDGSADVFPGAPERCDGVDDDCDGVVDEPDAEGAAVWYVDADGDGYGDPATAKAACDAPDGYIDVAGDCDDGDATTFPEASEVCGDGAANDCVGDAAEAWTDCAGAEKGLDVADLKLIGQTSGDNAGQSVSSAGDVDGDGLADLVVGATGVGAGGDDAGAAYLVLASSMKRAKRLDLSEADLMLVGAAARDLAGVSVAGVGDVDGDGLDDLLVGASDEDGGGSSAGAAYLVLGSTAVLASTLSVLDADLALRGETGLDYAGEAVAGAGDVDGDGATDLLVGARGDDTDGADAGAAYLVLGATAADLDDLALSDADLTLRGGAGGDGAGTAVAGAGDVDGDGLDDLLVGAPGDDAEALEAGAVYLVRSSSVEGAPWLDLTDADLTLLGAASTDHASFTAGAGDVDGDGLSDILVGAYYNDAGGSDAGAAYLVLGATAAGTATMALADAYLALSGETGGDHAGDRVAGAGDVDGDGLDDLLLGARDNDAGGSGAGAAYLVLGVTAAAGGSASLAEASQKLLGEADGDGAGWRVSGAGDVNGDGLAELVVGAAYNDDGGADAGAAYLVLGGGY